MLRIQQSFNEEETILSLSGRIDAEDIVELQRVLTLETRRQSITFDLQDVTLVGRDAVQFLAGCEADRVKLENCPAFIREWINTERGVSNRQKS